MDAGGGTTQVQRNFNALRGREVPEMTNEVMRDLAAGFASECDALHELLAPLPDSAWDRPTQFKGWTLNDILAHLAFFDTAASLALRDEAALVDLFSKWRAAVAAGTPSLQFTHAWLGNVRGAALLALWREQSLQVAQEYAQADPKRRIKWAGPDMSVRSSLSARLMETWSHAQAIYDLLGRTRVNGDYLRNVAELGINTYKWTFMNRGLPVPEPQPFVRLAAPSGAVWEWGSNATGESIEGRASEFCQVVAQTRNVADTALRVQGEIARKWMAIAQCFAGEGRDPPPPGTRFSQPGA